MSETAKIAAFGGRGEGIVRDGGKVIFVPGALPGETVRFRRVKRGQRFDHAELLEVVDPSPLRRATPCAHDHAGGCGGCNLLAVEPREGARLKAANVRELMERTDLDTGILEEARLPGVGIAYRNHARFLVVGGGRLAYVARAEGGRRGGRGKVPIDHCPTLHPELDRLRAAFDGRAARLDEVELRVAPTTGETLVILRGKELPKGFDPAACDGGVLWFTDEGSPHPLRGYPWIFEEIAGARLRISSGSFFQVNTAGAFELVGLVEEMCADAPERGLAIDLYAGVGLFALTALRGAASAIAVESDPSAALDLRENAAAHPALSVRSAECLSVLEDLIVVNETPAVAIADPPRSGLGPEMVEALGRLRPERLVLVSCDPRSFAGDVAGLVAQGFTLERAVPVDLFPGTHHLEVVALLRAR